MLGHLLGNAWQSRLFLDELMLQSAGNTISIINHTLILGERAMSMTRLDMNVDDHLASTSSEVTNAPKPQ